jgi:HSP20 family protein
MVEAELPGVDLEDLQVSFSSGTLVIEGVKEEVLGPGRVNFLCMERTFGAFRRLVPLLQPINAGRITARYSMGILQITIPKLEERRGTHRVIPVKSE